MVQFKKKANNKKVHTQNYEGMCNVHVKIGSFNCVNCRNCVDFLFRSTPNYVNKTEKETFGAIKSVQQIVTDHRNRDREKRKTAFLWYFVILLYIELRA